MNKVLRIMLLLTTLIVIVMLSGCKLAREVKIKSQQEDELIGAVITQEYVNLFDWNSYLKDNFQEIMNGHNTVASGTEYEQRLYATKKIVTTHGFETIDYEFEGMEGISMIIPTTYKPEINHTEIVSQCDPEITDIHVTTEEGSSAVEGTIRYVPQEETMFYLNPVYQTASGEVYLCSGTGLSVSTVSDGEPQSHGASSQTISQTYKEEFNGETTERKYTIKINYEPQPDNEEYIIKQFNEQDQLIYEQVVDSETIPESIKKQEGTEYLLVEGISYNKIGERVVARSIVKENETAINCYFANESSIMSTHSIIIEQ